MLMNYKKWIVAALVGGLSVTTLVACSSNGTPTASSKTPATTTSTEVSTATTEPKSELKSLQIWQKDDYNTYPVAKYLEEKTGYKVHYDMLPQDKPQDKLNILIASGEPYDTITTFGSTD
jgi:putative aldouronate transport system substrate-binding protein